MSKAHGSREDVAVKLNKKHVSDRSNDDDKNRPTE
jgi:hypothetical protein